MISCPTLLVWLLVGALLALAWIGVLTHTAWLHRLQDVPNERSSHSRRTPRGAGFVFPFALLMGVSDASTLIWALTALAISVLGFLDDAFTIRASRRFILQLLLILPFLILVNPKTGASLLQQSAWILFCALFVLASINFFNFADGINGYVALQFCLFLLSWFGLEGSRQSSFLYTCAPLLGALLVFLWKNMVRKAVFMGDSGSTFLGFLVATIPLQRSQAVPIDVSGKVEILLAAAAVFGFVVFIDTVTVLFAKVTFHIPLAQPHREHFYQRLSRRPNWGHCKTSLILLLIQAGISGLFLLGVKLSGVFSNGAFLILICICAIHAFVVSKTNFKAIRTYANTQ